MRGDGGGLVNLCDPLSFGVAVVPPPHTQLPRYSFIFHACAVCDLKCAIHSAADASQRLSARISLHSSQLSSLMVGEQLKTLCDQRAARHRSKMTNTGLEELSFQSGSTEPRKQGTGSKASSSCTDTPHVWINNGNVEKKKW